MTTPVPIPTLLYIEEDGVVSGYYNVQEETNIGQHHQIVDQ